MKKKVNKYFIINENSEVLFFLTKQLDKDRVYVIYEDKNDEQLKGEFNDEMLSVLKENGILDEQNLRFFYSYTGNDTRFNCVNNKLIKVTTKVRTSTFAVYSRLSNDVMRQVTEICNKHEVRPYFLKLDEIVKILEDESKKTFEDRKLITRDATVHTLQKLKKFIGGES